MSTMREYLATTLKTKTAEREARYRSQPDLPGPKGGPHHELKITVKSIGHLDEHVRTGSGHEFIISEPIDVGGRNIATWPLEYLLSGAVGCFAAVFAFYAAKMNVAYDEFEVKARAWVDTRGHMIPEAPPSGYQRVVLDIYVESDEPIERLQEVERLAMAGCPGIDTLRRPIPLESQVHLNQGA